MKGIRFGNYHSYDDFGLVLSSKEIGSPTVKTMKIDVEGADGALDLTDFFGEPKYQDVTHKFQFSSIVPQVEQITSFTAIKNAIHGKKMRIILDDDPLFYYVGRCFVSAWTNEKNIGTVSIECECEPWKHKLNVTRKIVYLYGKNILDVSNFRQGVLNATVGMTFEELTAFTTTTRIRTVVPFLVKPNTNYTVSFEEGFRVAHREFSKNRILVKSSTWNARAFTFKTASETETLSLYISYPNDAIILPADIVGRSFQIEEGSVATEYEEYRTDVSITASIHNLKKRVIPTIKATGNVVIQSGGYSLALNNTSTVSTGIEFVEGENSLTITGGGAVMFEYQEGAL